MHTLSKFGVPWGQLWLSKQFFNSNLNRKYFSVANKRLCYNKLKNNDSITLKQNELQKISLPALATHLKDAASYAEFHSDEQVAWPSSSFHQSESEVLLQQARAKKQLRALSTEAHMSIKNDDRNNSVILFPGQGAQFVGMGSKLIHLPNVKELYDSASEILGYDLLALCLEGPKEKLNSTRYCQPAIVVTSLAAVEALYQKDPDAIKSCIKTAGFSLGEITALIFSGVLSFEDGIQLVKTRAEAMEYSSELESSGMMTVFFGAKHQLALACQAARKWTEENGYVGAYGKAVCQIANHLYAGSKTLAGHTQALQFIEENKSDFGIKRVKRLPVSGAFHTELMQDAVQPLREALSLAKLNPPRISVYSNTLGEEYKTCMQISNTLPKQVVKAVKWEQINQRMFDYEVEAFYPRTFECGPGSSLSQILNKSNGKAAKKISCTSV